MRRDGQAAGSSSRQEQREGGGGRGEEHHADSMPLLRSHEEEEEADVRFAIDDEVAAESHSERLISPADGYDLEAEGGASSRRDQDASARHTKYPPLPPSYDDVIRQKRNQSSFFSTLKQHIYSLPQCLPEGFTDTLGEWWRRFKVFLWKLWPTSRLAHTFLILAGLWILVVLTGPSFEGFSNGGSNSGASWSWEAIEPYEEPPLPFAGDGRITQNASWALEGCQTEADPTGWSWWTWCYSKSEFELHVPPSFGAGDKLYLFADPPRGEQTHNAEDKRGKVRGVVRFVEESEDVEPPKDWHRKLKVQVRARYSRMTERYFRGITVAQLGQGRFSEGIGIYTRPASTQMGPLTSRAPLTLEITITIPKHTPIPIFEVETSHMDVILFDGTGDKKQKRHFDEIEADKSTRTHFGILNVHTERGLIGLGNSLGRPLETDGVLTLSSRDGNVVLGGDIHAHMLEFSSERGSIRLLKDAKVQAWREGTFKVDNGHIFLEEGSLVRGTTIVARTQNGMIDSAGRGLDRGTWYANHSLTLETQNGRIGANIGIEKPQMYGFRPEETQGGYPKTVTVRTSTQNGQVDIAYVSQAEDTPVDLAAKSSNGAVSVKLDPHFVGKLHLEGSGGSSVDPSKKLSDVDGQKRTLQVNTKKEGWTRVISDGSVARDKAKEIGDQSSVKVSSDNGKAKLQL